MRKRASLSFFDSIIVGVVVSLITIGFRVAFYAVHSLRHTLYETSVITKILWVVLVIGVALLSSFLLKVVRSSKQSGEDQVFAQLLGLSKTNSFTLVITKILGTISSAFSGLALDHGGPSMQVGAHVGKLMSSRAVHEKQKTMMLSGQSAGLAAAYSTPLAGTLFNLEVTNQSFASSLVLPSLVSATIADILCTHVFKLPHIIELEMNQLIPFHQYHFILILAIIIGLVAVLINVIIQQLTKVMARIKVDQNVYVFISFAIAIILFFVMPMALDPIPDILELTLPVLIALLIIKLLFTLIAFQSNAMGGLFLPLLVIGSIGSLIFVRLCVHYNLIDPAYTTPLLVIGMASLLGATLKAPLFAIIFVVELTGIPSMIWPIALGVLIASMVINQFDMPPFYIHQLGTLSHTKEVDFTNDKVIVQVYLSLDSDLDQKRIMDLTLPRGTLIISIYRYGQEVNVDGHVRLHAGDLITLVTAEDQQASVNDLFH